MNLKKKMLVKDFIKFLSNAGIDMFELKDVAVHIDFEANNVIICDKEFVNSIIGDENED